MARISNTDAEKYSEGNSSEWFSLKNDGDVARVQFMFADTSEIDVFTAHKIKLNDKDRYVDCLRAYEDELDVCPLCAEHDPLKVVRFIVMYDHGDNKMKIWERGKQFISRLEGLANRYYPLSGMVFEIERHGKAGDKQTTYEIYPCPNVQPIDLSELEKPELLGGIVLSKTREEMEHFIRTGSFPQAESAEEPATPTRRAPVNNAEASAPVSSRRSRRG